MEQLDLIGFEENYMGLIDKKAKAKVLRNGYKKTHQTDWISIITIEYPVDLIRFIIFLEI